MARDWMTGDEAINLQRLEGTVTRTSGRDRRVYDDESPDQREDRWVIGMHYQDHKGVGRKATVELSAGCYQFSTWSTPLSVQSRHGRFTFGRDAPSLESHHPVGGMDSVEAVLLRVAYAARAELCRLAGWEHRDSPLPSIAGVRESVSVGFDNVRLPVFRPEAMGAAGALDIFIDALKGRDPDPDDVPLMNATGDALREALLSRYESLAANGPPQGLTHSQALGDLVRAGLPLGAYPFTDEEEEYDAEERDWYTYQVSGTTSLLLRACRAGDKDAASALLDHGANPLEVLEETSGGKTVRKSPFMAAIEGGHNDIVDLIMARSPAEDCAQMLSRFEERFVHVNAKARRAAEERYPQLPQLYSYFAAARAREALAAGVAAPAPSA